MVPSGGIRLFDGMYEGLGNALDLVQARHQLGAANLANVNTPGYLAKQVPFKELLSEVMSAGVEGESLDVTERVRSAMTELQAPDYALDGNSVDLEAEAGRAEENKLMYQALVGGMSRRLAMLKFSATDGKS
ncbi:flagellar basal body rod protein FlgB [Deltaproteobacteria bacterium]|nr:flagellar basal body rod protein FlgB [Deltaproteobacteria bacterium]